MFGIINQDIYVQQNKNRKRYERDVMIVNLSKSYIINIEAKTNLGNCKRGAKQLQKTNEILKSCHFSDNIEKDDWKLIRILYGTKIGDDQNSCMNCQNYIITRNDNFIEKLSDVLDDLPIKDSFDYIKDFCSIISEILPDRYQCLFRAQGKMP